MAKTNNKTEIQDVHEGELGNLLRHYRDSIGYTTKQTADALCLAEAKIIKLENEEFNTLAEPPYIRGYLRSYAKLAEQDPTKLISLYESLRGASPEELEHHFKPMNSLDRKPSILPLLIRLLLLLLILGGLIALSMQPAVTKWFSNTWKSFSQQTDNKSKNHNGDNNPLLTGSMPAPLPIPVDQNSTDSATLQVENKNIAEINSKLADINKANNDIAENKIAQTTDKQVEKSSDEDTTKDKEQNKVEQNENKINENKTAEAELVTPSTHAKIKLVFNKEVWLRIKDKNKKTVYEGQTAAGKEKELELEKPLTFRIGNAQGISIFIDGETKDITKYIKGSVANFTIE